MGALLSQFMNKYAYTDFHELNADWMIRTMMELINQVENFVSLNAIKYADPIQWNIVRQYEKNTVVIDPLTGTAYISVQPVPMGVALTNTDYWTVVFDLGSFVVRAAKNFSNRYEADTTTTATFPSSVGDWVVWGDTLYEVISNIIAGDQYVVNSNIRHITMEEVTDVLAQAIQNVQNNIGDLNDLTTVDKSNIVAAINELVRRAIIFNTVADMISASYLVSGDHVGTNNYYNNDGFGNNYVISDTISDFGIALDNGLFANPEIDNIINVNKLGIVNGGNISSLLQSVVDYASTHNNIVGIEVMGGNYICDVAIDITSLNENVRDNMMIIDFHNATFSGNNNDFIVSTSSYTTKHVIIKNAYLKTFTSCFNISNFHFGCEISDIYAYNCDNVITANECYYLILDNITPRTIGSYTPPANSASFKFTGNTNLITIRDCRSNDGYKYGYHFQSCQCVKMLNCGIEGADVGLFVHSGYNMDIDSCYFENNADWCIEIDIIQELKISDSWFYHPNYIIKNNTRISNLLIDESNSIIFDTGKYFYSVNPATFGKIAFSNVLTPNAQYDIRTIYNNHNINPALQNAQNSITFNPADGYGTLLSVNDVSQVGKGKNIGRISPVSNAGQPSNVTLENNNDGTLIYHTSVIATNKQLVYAIATWADAFRTYEKAIMIYGMNVSYLDSNTYGFVTVANNNGLLDIVLHGGTVESPTTGPQSPSRFYLNILA